MLTKLSHNAQITIPKGILAAKSTLEKASDTGIHAGGAEVK